MVSETHGFGKLQGSTLFSDSSRQKLLLIRLTHGCQFEFSNSQEQEASASLPSSARSGLGLHDYSQFGTSELVAAEPLSPPPRGNVSTAPNPDPGQFPRDCTVS